MHTMVLLRIQRPGCYAIRIELIALIVRRMFGIFSIENAVQNCWRQMCRLLTLC